MSTDPLSHLTDVEKSEFDRLQYDLKTQLMDRSMAEHYAQCYVDEFVERFKEREETDRTIVGMRRMHRTLRDRADKDLTHDTQCQWPWGETLYRHRQLRNPAASRPEVALGFHERELVENNQRIIQRNLLSSGMTDSQGRESYALELAMRVMAAKAQGTPVNAYNMKRLKRQVMTLATKDQREDTRAGVSWGTTSRQRQDAPTGGQRPVAGPSTTTQSEQSCLPLPQIASPPTSSYGASLQSVRHSEKPLSASGDTSQSDRGYPTMRARPYTSDESSMPPPPSYFSSSSVGSVFGAQGRYHGNDPESLEPSPPPASKPYDSGFPGHPSPPVAESSHSVGHYGHGNRSDGNRQDRDTYGGHRSPSPTSTYPSSSLASPFSSAHSHTPSYQRSRGNEPSLQNPGHLESSHYHASQPGGQYPHSSQGRGDLAYGGSPRDPHSQAHISPNPDSSMRLSSSSSTYNQLPARRTTPEIPTVGPPQHHMPQQSFPPPYSQYQPFPSSSSPSHSSTTSSHPSYAWSSHQNPYSSQILPSHGDNRSATWLSSQSQTSLPPTHLSQGQHAHQPGTLYSRSTSPANVPSPQRHQYQYHVGSSSSSSSHHHVTTYHQNQSRFLPPSSNVSAPYAPQSQFPSSDTTPPPKLPRTTYYGSPSSSPPP